jgi:hypothetical protein
VALINTFNNGDPITAVRELKRFSQGAHWLLRRWKQIAFAIEKGHFWTQLVLSDEATRLLGAHPDETVAKRGPAEGFVFGLYCVIAHPETTPEYLKRLLCNNFIHREYLAVHGRTVPNVETAKKRVTGMVKQEIEDLEYLVVDLERRERLELKAMEDQAVVPEDSPDARLLIRYHREATSAFHRAYKELTKLQEARLAAEIEDETAPTAASDEGSRNEANGGSEPQSSAEGTTGCDEPKAAVSEPVAGSDSVLATAVVSAEVAGASDMASTVPVVPVIPPPELLV